MNRTVAIIQRRMTHYRLPLFEKLRTALGDAGIGLRVLHGDARPNEATKNDAGILAWAEHLPTRYVAGGRICWQPYLHRVKDCSLVIVTQENKLVNNLPALVLKSLREQKIAFWGHGRDMQTRKPNTASERFKRWTTRQVDWWFAYTEISAGFVQDAGFPRERITILNNSIDTAELQTQVVETRLQGRDVLKAKLGLPPTALVGVFIGSLYPEKRISWLLAAAEKIHLLLPRFHLVLAGGGPESALVQSAVASSAAVSYLGVVRNKQKAELLAAADLMLNPGAVGLSILDAFAAGLPMLTTACGTHGPEIAYLAHDRNGLITADNLEAYVAACVGLLAASERLNEMQASALDSANIYSIENMIGRFQDGVIRAIA